MPRLRAIASISTGTDHIAIEAAEQRDIALLTAPGANSRAVAEHALTLALALTKQVFPGNRACRTGLDWAGLPHLPRRLSGQQDVGANVEALPNRDRSGTPCFPEKPVWSKPVPVSEHVLLQRGNWLRAQSTTRCLVARQPQLRCDPCRC